MKLLASGAGPCHQPDGCCFFDLLWLFAGLSCEWLSGGKPHSGPLPTMCQFIYLFSEISIDPSSFFINLLYLHSSPWPCRWRLPSSILWFLLFPLHFLRLYRRKSALHWSLLSEGKAILLKSLGWCLPLSIFNVFLACPTSSWSLEKGVKSPLPLIIFFIVSISSCSSGNLHTLYFILPSFQDFENSILIRREDLGHHPTFMSLVTLGQSLNCALLVFHLHTRINTLYWKASDR